MKFLAMIIALSAHQVLQPGNLLQRDQWLSDYDAFVARHVRSPGLRTLLVLAGLLLLSGWLLALVKPWLFGLVELFATVALFLWSLGREDYHTALERLQAQQDDSAAALQAVDGLWVPGAAADTASAGSTADPDPDPEHVRYPALRRIAYGGFARWFAPLFYFVLAGPLAAVLYRATALLAARGRDTGYERLLAWLDWIPARLLVLTFALTGDFLAISRRGPLRHFTDGMPAPQLLADAACSAGGDISARAVGDILYRSAGLWLLLLSVGLIVA